MTCIRTQAFVAIALISIITAATAGELAETKPGTIANGRFQKGVSLGGAHWRKDEYANLDWTLDKAKEYGVSHILVIPNGFLYPGNTGNEIRKVFFDGPLYETDPRFQSKEWGWWGASLTDAQLREIAGGCKARGMKLVIKPHIDPWDGTSRGAATPKDPEAFFRNYNAFVTHYASLAEELSAVLFVIGTELSNIDSTEGALAKKGVDVTGEWRKIIRSVRNVYRGKITYSASAFGDWKTWKPEHIAKGPYHIKFWDDLDYIGFEPYFGVTRKNDPSPGELARGFMEKFALYVEPLSKQYDKPILLTEVNGYAFDSMNTDPIAMYTEPEDHPLDHKEQADYYDALFQTITKLDYVEGAYIWPFFIKPSAAESDEDYFKMQQHSHRDSLLGVPAGKVLKSWYRAINAPEQPTR
jgi:hypothetical protein